MGTGGITGSSYPPIGICDNIGHWAPIHPQAESLAPRADAFPTIHTNAIYADVLGTVDVPNHPVSDAATGRIVWRRTDAMFQALKLCYVGADNSQADHRLWGLTQISNGSRELQYLWSPIATFTGTAGTKTGIAGGIITANLRYVDAFSSLTDYGYNIVELKPPTPDQSPVTLRWEARDFAFFVLESSTNAPATKATGIQGIYRGWNGGA